ncbi:AbiJ-NTD4 domain-containing protein [Kosmotoga olearia]|uniref:HEPN AbiJ-N-terminal domain-containing protein n=1 Tax=Kosmotoga olearia (strain ATCC BAA-1733 / DSM 21960 / TBF 19.5.1) TaxID=521045 RepID=C5CH41_KOSOT|nr:hypothetical protein [Kosmotoga olearia]ACR80644.1 conserved hypothetical protein [Kosmotoga olearia TBF 19.5.1]
MRFSERMGYKKPKTEIQYESMDDDLRNRIWSLLYSFYWGIMEEPEKRSYLIKEKLRGYENEYALFILFRKMWFYFLKKPIDEMPTYWPKLYSEIRKIYFSFPWYEVYDFIEFIVDNFGDKGPKGKQNEGFIDLCNEVLKEELSAYRFVDGVITPITNEIEISEIEHALESTSHLEGVNTHLKSALKLFSDKKNPDYRNSIKESISAIEALCRLISKDDKATLGKALKIIEESGKCKIHGSLKAGFEKIYGYTSDEHGIRHSLLDKDSELDQEDARFMLVSCSAFVNYLIVKANKGGITIN